MLSEYENLIIDSTSTGFQITDNEIGANVNLNDLTALLILCAKYKHKTPYRAKFKFIEDKIQELDIHFYTEDLPKNLIKLIMSKPLTKKHFHNCKKQAADYFKNGVKGKGFGKKITVKVERPDSTEDRSFVIYPSKVTSINKETNEVKEQFYLNFSCAPTTILTGENSLPIKLFNNEDSICLLIELPAIIINNLINKYVLNKVEYKGAITKQLEAGTLYVNRLQSAMYTSSFKSKKQRDNALKILHSLLSNVNHKNLALGGISVAEVLKCKIESSKTVYEKDKNNRIVGLSGFLVQKFYGTKPDQSVGFYAKDIVSENVIEKTIPLRIRLDVTLQSIGLKKFCKKVLNTESSIEATIVNINTIKNVFKVLFKDKDKTTRLVDFVLFEQLRFDQLLCLSRKNWEDAFDILEQEGFSKFLENLKEWGGSSSFSALVYDSPINKHNLYDKLYKVGKKKLSLKDKILNETGVDITFPYAAWRAGIINIRNLFIPDEQLLNMTERNKSNLVNHKINERAVKLAYKRTKQIAGNLRKNGASYLPTKTVNKR